MRGRGEGERGGQNGEGAGLAVPGVRAPEAGAIRAPQCPLLGGRAWG